MKVAKSNHILTYISSTFLLLTLTILDVLSIGTKIYRTSSHGEHLETFNMAIYVVSAVISQCSYGAFSKLQAGVCGGPIYEAAGMTRAIHDICEERTETAVESVTNAYIAISVSTMFFAVISYTLGRFDAGRLFKFLPKTAICGVMASIGIGLLQCGMEEIYIGDACMRLHISFAITILLVFIAYKLDQKYPGNTFFLSGCSLVITLVFHLLAYLSGYDIPKLRQEKLLPEEGAYEVATDVIFRYLDMSKFDFFVFMRCIPSMINMACTNLIHVTVNIPAFANTFDLDANINDEFKAQGMSNLFTSFIGYPSYFINCTSVFFNKAGGRTRIHSIISGLSLLVLLYIGPKARLILPCILLAFIPMYIGMCFVMDNLICNLSMYSNLDMSVILLSCIVGYQVNPISGLLSGLAYNAIIILYAYSIKANGVARLADKTNSDVKINIANNGLSIANEETTFNDKYMRGENAGISSNEANITQTTSAEDNTSKGSTLVIDFMSYNLTRDMFTSKFTYNIPDNHVLNIDLSGCAYMDVESNLFLYEYIGKCNGVIQISGTPFNLYTHLFDKYLIK